MKEERAMNNSYPFLCQACRDDFFGSKTFYNDGAVYEAGFIYLAGEVNAQQLDNLETSWKYRMFVCLSQEWEKALLLKYKNIVPVTRYQMKLDMFDININNLEHMIQSIPAQFSISEFNEKAFNEHPFKHGMNYKNYEEFRQMGVGAVIWHNDKIVASASSYLTYHNEVELDISTLPEYRRKGLGMACAAKMILICKGKNIIVHWDAQNIASKCMAEKLGYKLEHEYIAYGFFSPEEV